MVTFSRHRGWAIKGVIQREMAVHERAVQRQRPIALKKVAFLDTEAEDERNIRELPSGALIASSQQVYCDHGVPACP